MADLQPLSGSLDSSSPRLSSRERCRIMPENTSLPLISSVMSSRFMMSKHRSRSLKNQKMDVFATVCILRELAGTLRLIYLTIRTPSSSTVNSLWFGSCPRKTARSPKVEFMIAQCTRCSQEREPCQLRAIPRTSVFTLNYRHVKIRISGFELVLPASLPSDIEQSLLSRGLEQFDNNML